MPHYRKFQYQQIAFTIFIAAVPVTAEIAGPVLDPGIQQQIKFQYQGTALPTFVPGAEDVTVDKWFRELSEPVRTRPALLASIQRFVTADPVPIPALESSWHQPWTEPRRFRVSVSVQNQPFSAQDVLSDTQLTDTFESRWHQPWSEPVRQKQGLRADLQQSAAFDPFPRPETLTSANWYLPLSEPVRQKPGLGASLQQFTTIDPFLLTQPEQVDESKWHQPWSDPTRRKWPSEVSQISGPIWAPFTPEATTLDKWFALFSEPVRQKPGLQAQYQQFLAIDPFILTQPERVSEDKWHQPWSEPTRRKGRAASSAEVTPPITVTPPTLPPATVITTVQFDKKTYYQSIAAPAFTPPPEVVTADKWLYGWSEPVRQKKGLRTHLQQFATIDPFILTQPERVSEDKWHQPWSEPVRQKRGLRAYLQHFIEPDPFPRPTAPTVFPGSWYEPFSEPVRQKRGLAARYQQFFTIETTLIPNPSAMMEGWFGWLAEPVRQKPGLQASLQPFKAYLEGPDITQGTVFVTINATETNNDYFVAAIRVYISLPARRALVSIIEVPIPGNDPLSIIEV